MLRLILLCLTLTLCAYDSRAVINAPDITVTTRVENGNRISDRDGNGVDSAINQAPTITLTGASTVTYTEGDTYNELGATCTDPEDGSIVVPAPSFAPALNMNAAGSYIATYPCTDSGSLTDQVTRTVNVNSAPVGGQLAFTNANLSSGADIPQVFWAGMPDVNGDGCLDVYIGAHADDVNSAMHIQDNVGGVCQGTFTFFADADNYSQASPTTPRITSRYIWGNWYGHPEGFWSFTGADVDGSASARYVLDPTFTTVGGNPSYLTKSTGCFGERPKCLPLDIDGDHSFEMVSRLYASPYNNAYIVNISTGATIYPSTGGNDQTVGGLTVADIDNDGVPEVVAVGLGGYYEYDSVGSDMDLVSGVFTGGPSNWTTGNHQLAFDYDNDGDLDIYAGAGEYNQSGNGLFEAYLFRNDGGGTFTNVTSTALAGISFYNAAYHTTYGNSQIGDVDLDGDLDIIFCSEEFDDTIVFILNDGDGTFSRHADIETTPVNFGLDDRRPWCQVADYDNDGKLDVVHNGARSGNSLDGQLYRNTTTTSNHWIQIRVRGSGDNTDGLHSRVTVFEAGTSTILTHQQIGVFSAGYQNMRVHTGTAAHTLVDVRVEYPHGGATCDFSNVAVDQNYVAFPSCDLQQYTPGSAIPLTYVASVNTTLTLTADSGVTPTSTELVTFGLPFKKGAVTNLDEIKVSIGGSEVAAYVESGLTYHWSDNSIRSATIQLQNVDMTGGDVTVTVDDTGYSVARLTEQPHSNGWATAGADKDNRQYPRIFALHDPAYLADSGIIPPFTPAPGTQDAFEDYQVAQFNNNFSGLNYQSSSNANWLFDRSSAMFKVYMTTGRVEFLKEAFLSKQFYFQHVRNDGTTPQASGGDGCWTYGGTACADGKYIAPQQAKLALALVGDDSQWDNSLIIEMAQQANLGWNQYGSADTFDNENEGFTERGAGLTGLAEIVAYEMTGDAGILSTMNSRIASLKDMQQTVKAWDTANGWTPKSGGFDHNLDVHEGVCSEGTCPTGDTNARGFSAWMSENIADFLWQAYWITGNADVPEILRQLADAVDQYGFTTTFNGSTYDRKAAFSGANHTQTCNTEAADTDMLYFASAYADNATIASGDWWPYYTDNHNIETVLTLAAGHYFETDNAIKTRLAARINKLVNGWSNASCATVFTNVYRLFNWQHRSNSVRTWDWVEANS